MKISYHFVMLRLLIPIGALMPALTMMDRATNLWRQVKEKLGGGPDSSAWLIPRPSSFHARWAAKEGIGTHMSGTTITLKRTIGRDRVPSVLLTRHPPKPMPPRARREATFRFDIAQTIPADL